MILIILRELIQDQSTAAEVGSTSPFRAVSPIVVDLLYNIKGNSLRCT